MLFEEMSPAKTCFILGAGASKPYGYWLGSELKREILRYCRLLCYLVRCRVVEDDGEGQTRFLADDLAEREPALAQLAAAAIAGLPVPSGPDLKLTRK